MSNQSPLPDGESRAEYTLRLRQQHSVPVLTAFKAWLDEVAPQVLPESLAGKAIAYTRNQWEYLVRYADDGRAPIGYRTNQTLIAGLNSTGIVAPWVIPV